ncbi:MAG: LysM peptidoglycan-binding domain-containing protein [Chitinophagales bacterium]
MSTTPPQVCPAGSVPYTVKRGDTLYLIAQRLGTTVDALTNLNPKINPAVLQIGQVLCIPGTAPPPACTGTLYTIQPGDTFFGLAARYGTTIESLQSANPGVDPSRLQVGQTICIPVATPTVVGTPCVALLAAVTTNLPPISEIPVGALVIRPPAMSTRVYTMVAEALPQPSAVGNYDGYAGVLALYNPDTGRRETVSLMLSPSTPSGQYTVWAGSILASILPTVGDVAEVRPINRAAGGTLGPALLRGDLANCRA